MTDGALSKPSILLPEGATILAAVLGGGALWALGLPAAWLTGAMIAVALLTTTPLTPRLSKPFTASAMLLTGVGLGASVTPEMVAGIRAYPLSLVALAIITSLNSMAQYYWMTRALRWDGGTALFASAPGALSAVMATAASLSVDLPRVAIVQSVRVFLLVAVLPTLIVQAGGASGASVAVAPESLLDLAITVASGALCAYLFSRANITAPILFGGMIASAILHVTQVVHGPVPPLLANASFVLMGAMIGLRFNGLSGALFRALVFVAIGAFAIGMGITVIGVGVAASLLGMSYGKVMVAFAPGALEAMIALSAALALDPLYVGAHHLARFLGVSLMLPFFVRAVRAQRSDDD